MSRDCFCPQGIPLCSSCHMRHTTNSFLAAWLHADTRRAWYVSRNMSISEQQEMARDLRAHHGLDWKWTRERDILHKQKSLQEQRARQLRLRQLFLQEQEQQQEQRMLQQRQEEQQRKLQLKEQQKREHLLDEQSRQELQFRRELAATVQDYRLLWKLKDGNEQRRQPDLAPRFRRPPGRPLPSLRPFPATGTMPVL